ncbi:MAG: hypothetical protein KAI85_03420 [Halopseudomonas aestusnigri]|nr:hypothetical protein [Halopseudomonas aestusnigri]
MSNQSHQDVVVTASQDEGSTAQAVVIDALKQAIQNAHRTLRKSGFDMSEIDKALEMADQAKARKPRVLVVVDGGLADAVSDPGVAVEIFDWDRFNENPEEVGRVPYDYADLAEPCGIPAEAIA